jgi:TrmH family RNA methyltransferase
VVDEGAMAALAETVAPQGIVGVCNVVDVALDDVPGDARLIAVCADVRDPGNAGVVIRCADAAGADALVLAGTSVDPYNGKCVRASAGSLFHLPVVTAVSVQEVSVWCRARGLRMLAADAGGASLDDEIASGRLSGPTAWLFGNEAHGLSPADTASADAAVGVPIYGQAESLNLATAAAVCLYASARAQRAR